MFLRTIPVIQFHVRNLNYYKVLGVEPTATQAEIKHAYFELSKKYHPDKMKSSPTEDRMKVVTEAYSSLKSEKSRKEYDQKFVDANTTQDNTTQTKSKHSTSSKVYEASTNYKNPLRSGTFVNPYASGKEFRNSEAYWIDYCSPHGRNRVRRKVDAELKEDHPYWREFNKVAVDLGAGNLYGTKSPFNGKNGRLEENRRKSVVPIGFLVFLIVFFSIYASYDMKTKTLSYETLRNCNWNFI